LNTLSPTPPKGPLARHLNVLATMTTGIVGAHSTSLPAVAGKSALDALLESRVKRITRWIQDEQVNGEIYFLPFALSLLRTLALNGLTLVIDGSTVGRGCVALVIGVVYKQRALPIAWTVVAGKKRHFPEAMHIDLIKEVEAAVPDGVEVTLLGDGEFDGVDLQALVNGWRYVLRTAKNITLYWR
jgi:hypothetical protein